MAISLNVQALEDALSREELFDGAPNPFIKHDGRTYLRYDQIRIDVKKDTSPESPPLNVPEPLFITFMWHGKDLYHVEVLPGDITTIDGRFHCKLSSC